VAELSRKCDQDEINSLTTLARVTLRDEFPVLDQIAYLNAGTDGPVSRRAAAAAAASIAAQAEAGRAGKSHFEAVMATREDLRRRAAWLMGCPPGEVALTHSTTDGMNLVLHGLGLGRGDEVVTTDEEHPGLLAPLAALAAEAGITVKFAPFAEIANAVTPQTKLIACSHVSWVNGQLVDTDALAATGVPVLLDGAQGLGAIPVHPEQLGCAFYAAAGQKWLCGPDQSGFLYVHEDWIDRLGAPWPGYQSLADAQRAAELPLAEGATRFDLGFPAPHDGAWAVASFEVLERAGWDEVLMRGPALAGRLAEQLRERGLDVAPRGTSTLVSFSVDDPEGFVERAAAAGVVIRYLPGRGIVRASVGAWSDESDLERLLALTCSP
jgi:L-cysteine/cystine lyase